MVTTPRLADVHCERIQFQPGDRVLVKLYQSMDKESVTKLIKTVQRWAGVDVEVLVVDLFQMGIEIERGIAQQNQIP